MHNPTGEILLIIVLVLINGYFAAAEIALISARKSRLQQLSEEGKRGAAAALKLIEDPTRLLATIQTAITLVGMLASATAAVALAAPLKRWFVSLGWGPLSHIASGLALFLITLIIAYFNLVLGELVPKRLGLQRADGVASAVSRPVTLLAAATRPVVWLLTASTNVVSRLFGIKPGDATTGVSEEEIQLMVAEQDTLEDEEKRMINEIFDFGDTVVREVMVPRVDMMFVEDTQSVREAAEYLHATGFSRAPVFHEDFDKIIGILVLKDLVLPLSDARGDDPISAYLHEPVFVPETKDLIALLKEMQQDHYQLAVVVDEYGGTSGMVTMEDIAEEIVGEFDDEFDRDTVQIRVVGPGEWAVPGDLDVPDAIDLGFPLEESDEYDTIAGWLLDMLDHIPHVGEKLEHEGYRFTVIAMRRRRISRIRVQRLAPRADGSGGEGAASGAESEGGTDEGC
ncbi:MAG: hemolysin family protein [Coriobacteriia bacterium]|nr:hemolysin family protein [Coriobacteriia bacterium]